MSLPAGLGQGEVGGFTHRVPKKTWLYLGLAAWHWEGHFNPFWRKWTLNSS